MTHLDDLRAALSKVPVVAHPRVREGKVEWVDAHMRDLGYTKRQDLLDAMHSPAQGQPENRYAVVDRRNENDLTPGERAVLKAVQSRVGVRKLAELKATIAKRGFKPDRRTAGYRSTRPGRDLPPGVNASPAAPDLTSPPTAESWPADGTEPVFLLDRDARPYGGFVMTRAQAQAMKDRGEGFDIAPADRWTASFGPDPHSDGPGVWRLQERETRIDSAEKKRLWEAAQENTRNLVTTGDVNASPSPPEKAARTREGNKLMETLQQGKRYRVTLENGTTVEGIYRGNDVGSTPRRRVASIQIQTEAGGSRHSRVSHSSVVAVEPLDDANASPAAPSDLRAEIDRVRDSDLPSQQKGPALAELYSRLAEQRRSARAGDAPAPVDVTEPADTNASAGTRRDSPTSDDDWRVEVGGLTWDQAEERLHDGRWSQRQWEAYAYLWATRSSHMSSLGQGYENPSPDAKALADTVEDPRERRP